MSEQSSFPLSHRERYLIWILTFFLCIMLGALLKERLLHPSLTVHVPGNSMQACTGTASQEMDEVAMLMQSLSQNPQDTGVLLRLARIFTGREQWKPAEDFTRQALAADPRSFQGHFLLGIILHRQERYADAAASLEQALQLKDDGSARYSLAVLYCYYLNRKEKGLEHLSAALRLPDLSETLKQTITDELKKQSGN